MQISSSRPISKRSTVDMLMELGYSKSKAENLYKKYKDWEKLDELQNYIQTKQSLTYKPESIPLRDM